MDEDKKLTISQYVCFKLGDEEYALNIMHVQEVIRLQKITPIPQMPHFTLGVVNIRGNILPVFDLRRKFLLPEKPFDNNTKMVVVNIDDVMISFIVDEILDNIKFDVSQIDPTPPVKMKIDQACIKGIGELPNRMVILIDLNRIHENIKQGIMECS